MKNKFVVNGDTTTIYLKYKGEEVECYIDTADLPFLQQFDVTWYGCAPKDIVYAQAGWRKEDGKRTSMYLHKLLMQPPKGKVVDHIDGNGLNCRRSNMSVVSQKENVHNKNRLLSTNKSGYTGVHWKKERKKWKAAVYMDNKEHFLGYFDEAEKAYEAVVAFKQVYMPYLVEIGKIPRSNQPEPQQTNPNPE